MSMCMLAYKCSDSVGKAGLSLSASILKYAKSSRILLITILIALFASSAYGASYNTAVKATAFFNKGNRLYRDGKFESAEKNYRKALLTGIESRDLYYNMGNACFRQKKYGWARLYYEKALRLSPGDRDTHKNLELIISFLGIQVSTTKPSFLAAILSGFLSILSTSGWVYIVCVLYFVLSGIAIAKLLLCDKDIKYINFALWSASSALVMFAFLLGSKVYLGWTPSGIVVERSVAVKSAPKLADSSLFTLNGGDKVTLYEARGEWVFVNMPGKSSGWVPVKSVEKI